LVVVVLVFDVVVVVVVVVTHPNLFLLIVQSLASAGWSFLLFGLH
jgi:hypothetical protein